MSAFIQSVLRQFKMYKSLGDKTIEQLQLEHLSWHYNNESNSIIVLVKHLKGNMLSRWTDFLHSDGEKEWRHRDKEFEESTFTKDQVIQVWEEGWKCLFDAIENLTDEQLENIIYIRQQPLTVMDAILRQLAHYSYHVGQMVYIGKMIRNDQWHNLSIPRGHSEDYNNAMKK